MCLVWIKFLRRRRFHIRFASSMTSSRKVGPVGLYSSINSARSCLYWPESSPGIRTASENTPCFSALRPLHLRPDDRIIQPTIVLVFGWIRVVLFAHGGALLKRG